MSRPMFQSSFYQYDKIPEQINLKEERFVLAHNFKAFSPCSPGSVVSGLAKEVYHDEEDMMENLMTVQKQRGMKKHSTKYSIQEDKSRIYFPQPGPTS